MIGESPLGHEAEADVKPLVHPAALDEAVHLRTLLDHPGDGHDEAVEQGGPVVRMLQVFLLDVFHQLSGVDLFIHIDLRLGALGH